MLQDVIELRQVIISKTVAYFKTNSHSQTCIKRSPLGQRKSGLSTQVTS